MVNSDVELGKDNLKVKAYNYLYEVIIKHKLRPGTPIVEQEISKTLGISRTPIREALKQLESEGLVKHIPGRGTLVSELTLQDVEEIFALRELLELWALKISWTRITDQELDEMEKALSRLDGNCSEDDFYECDRRLHELIVNYAGNRRLINFLNTINAQVERLRQIAIFRPGRLQESKNEHLAIIHCLKERDYHKTEDVLRNHIQSVKKNTLEVFMKYQLINY